MDGGVKSWLGWLPAWAKDSRLLYLLIATIVTLSLAWAVKGPCVIHPWEHESQYRKLCYNDIQPLYGARSLDLDVMPYVGDGTNQTNPDSDHTPRGFNEYPVLTGLTMYAAALLTPNGDPQAGNIFFLWNAAFLSLFAIGTTIALYFAQPDKSRVAYFAAGPPIALYAFHNWDLIAVFFGALGLAFFLRGRYGWSGAALAAGTSAKLFPLFFAPFLGLWLLHRDGRLSKDGWRFGLGFLGSALVINGPFFVINRDLFLATYRFHLRRTPNFETLWWVLNHFGERWHIQWLQELGTKPILETYGVLLLAILLVGVGLGVLLGRLGPVEGALAGLVAFMLLNKIFSVQYALWVLPFFALLKIPDWKYGFFVAADTAVYIAIFTIFLHFADGQFERYAEYLGWAVVARVLALGTLFVHAAIQRRGSPTPPLRRVS